MAVGTTRPTLSATWAAITDQANVWITHDGGSGVVEIAVASSAPAASAYGRKFKWGDEPLHFVLASGEEVYARCTAPDPTLPIITVMQSALFGVSSPARVLGAAACYASASFTPSAAAYSANDIMDASKEFAFTFSDGTPIPAGSIIRILTSTLRVDISALQASEAGYQLQLYDVTQPSNQADNDAWTLASGDLTAYRGAMAIGTPVDLGAALYVRSPFQDFDVRLTTSSLWARLQTLAGFTATAVARQAGLVGIVL